MDEDPSYEPGERDSPWSTARVSGRCGCIAALLFGFPVASVVGLGMILGDCVNGDPCHQNDNRNLLVALAIVLALGSVFGFAVRTLVRWWRLRRTREAPGVWSLAWAIPVALLLGLLAIWCALATASVI